MPGLLQFFLRIFRKFNPVFNNRVFSGFIILVFCILTLWNIDYPGLNTDEATNGVPSVNIFRDAGDIAGGKVPLLYCHVVLFDKIFPIMQSQYCGATVAYLAFPFVRLFGPSALALRICSVFFFRYSYFFYIIFVTTGLAAK